MRDRKQYWILNATIFINIRNMVYMSPATGCQCQWRFFSLSVLIFAASIYKLAFIILKCNTKETKTKKLSKVKKPSMVWH